MKKKGALLVWGIIALMLLASCETVPPAVSADKQRIYDVDYDLLFNAAKMILLDKGFKITTISKDGGLLQAEKILMSTDFTEMLVGEKGGILDYYDITFLPGSRTTVYLENYAQYKDGTARRPGRQDAYLQFWAQLEEKLGSK